MLIVIKYASLDLIAVLGAYIVLKKAKFPDFGILASFLISSFLSAKFLSFSLSPIYLIFLGLISGSIVGFSTSFFHFRLNIHPLISGLASLFLAYSACFFVFKEGSGIAVIDEKYLQISDSDFMPIITVFLLYSIIVLFLFTIESTNFGIKLRAFANTKNSLSFLDITESHYVSILLGIGNGLVGLSASLNVFFVTRAVNVNMTPGVFETFIFEMILGLVIYDFLNSLSLPFLSDITNKLKAPSTSRLVEFAIPILGVMIYHTIFNISVKLFGSNYASKAIIAVIVVSLIYLASMKDGRNYSKLEFRGQ